MNPARLAWTAAVATTLVTLEARAHEGHEHKVMGTVAAVDAAHVEVRGTDGRLQSIRFAPTTRFVRGGKPSDAGAVRPEARIVVKFTEAKDTKIATQVELPSTAPTPAR
ncbi:MAG: hypothetical protein IPK07_00100 [Deltaproteobacteria bacterium]|jgi:hypothetical protein|nr:hypothetical protein [Deltaproteobacteria bacterium]